MLGKNPAALMRAVGRVTLLVIVAGGVWSFGAQVAACAGGHGGCAAPSAGWVAFQLWRSLFPIAALVAFHASLRPRRARRAVSAAVSLLVLELALPIFWAARSSPAAEVARDALWAWALDEVWLIVGVGMFAASYRRPRTPVETSAPLGESVSGRLWVAYVLAPLIATLWLWAALTPLSPNVGVLLVAGGLYGLLHRHRPVPAAASWASVTLTLLLLAIPHQIYAVVTNIEYSVIEPKLVLAVAVASGAALAGWQLYRTRRHRDALDQAPVRPDPA